MTFYNYSVYFIFAVSFSIWCVFLAFIFENHWCLRNLAVLPECIPPRLYLSCPILGFLAYLPQWASRQISDTYFLPGQQSMSCFHPSHFPLLQSSPHFPAGLFLLCQTQGIRGFPADDIPCLCWSSCEMFPVLFTLGRMSSSQGQGYRILWALQSKLFPIVLMIYRKPNLAGYESLGHTFYSD